MTQVAFAPDVFTWPADEPQLIGGRCTELRGGDVPAAAVVRALRLDRRRARTCCPAGGRCGRSRRRSSCRRSPTPAARRGDVPALRRRHRAARRRGAGRGPADRERPGDAAHRHGDRARDRAVPHRRRRHRGHDVRVRARSTERRRSADDERRRHHRGGAAPVRPVRRQVGHRHGRRRRSAPRSPTPASQWTDVQFAFGGQLRGRQPRRRRPAARPHRHPVHGRLQRLRHRGDRALQLTADAIRSGEYDIGVAVGMDKHQPGRVHVRPRRLRAPALVRRDRPLPHDQVLRHEDQPLHARPRHLATRPWRRWRPRTTATARSTRTPSGASRSPRRRSSARGCSTTR